MNGAICGQAKPWNSSQRDPIKTKNQLWELTSFKDIREWFVSRTAHKIINWHQYCSGYCRRKTKLRIRFEVLFDLACFFCISNEALVVPVLELLLNTTAIPSRVSSEPDHNDVSFMKDSFRLTEEGYKIIFAGRKQTESSVYQYSKVQRLDLQTFGSRYGSLGHLSQFHGSQERKHA